ncbi:potassium channel family protein [Yeosuana sp.]|uniref:potassium channel family protein n=1 Tax=Yeosuana sp. TaxID=2529388 RepID=UPI004054EABF
MSERLNKIREKSFYKLLFGRTALPVLTIVGIAVIYVLLMSLIDHRSFPFHIIIASAALIKTILITATTLKQLSKMIEICHSIKQLLWVFGAILFISIFSFATDYTCLSLFNNMAFEGVPVHSNSYLSSLYHFFYFSVITFSNVGYGDITPVSEVAKFVVMLEIFLSFFLIVFALANIKKIHLNE